jgi:hypothetical protein
MGYLYSWPLVGQVGNSPPFMIQKLDFDSERALLFKALDNARKAVTLRMECATADNLRALVTMGCRTLHYTGHGLPSCLAFEVCTTRAYNFTHRIIANNDRC